MLRTATKEQGVGGKGQNNVPVMYVCLCIVCAAVIPWGSDWASAASAFRAASGSASNQRDSESVIDKNTHPDQLKQTRLCMPVWILQALS